MTDRHAGPLESAITLDSATTKARPQVLVVDDTKQVRDLIVWLLRFSGYRAIVAEDGLAAQRILRSEHPALIISDLNMPGGDGWTLLAHCHEHHPDIPVLIVSGEELGRHPEIECWAAGFVAKPFNVHQFRSELDRCRAKAA